MQDLAAQLDALAFVGRLLRRVEPGAKLKADVDRTVTECMRPVMVNPSNAGLCRSVKT